jgi:dienelactone hydrolase
MRVYESQLKTTGKVPGVIVIMEAVGINKHIREVADKPSGKGYVAVALVLHHRLDSNQWLGYVGEDAEAHTKAMGSLRDDERPSDHAEASKDAWARTPS